MDSEAGHSANGSGVLCSELGHGEIFRTVKILGPSPVQAIWTLPRSNSHSAVALGDLTP